MDWSRSYTSQWRVFRVNRETWADSEQINNVDEASITKTADGKLLESGNIGVTGELETDYYRIVMTAEQGGSAERIDVATLLFESKGGKHDYGTWSQDPAGHSVLYPASKTALLAGEYAPAGVNGAEYAASLLRRAINAPVMVEGSFTLNENVVHEIGASVLDAVWSVLDAGNFVIQIDGRGIVHILERPSEPSLQLDSYNMRILSNGIDYDADKSGIPNRYIVITGNSKTIATNDDPASEISTVSRGYFVDSVDESPVLVNGETASGYAKRKLREASVVREKYTYTREFSPDVALYSIVRASIDGLYGDLRVTAQDIDCKNGVTIQEKAMREVSLW